MRSICWGCTADTDVRRNKTIDELLCRKCSTILYEVKAICEECGHFQAVHFNRETKKRICRNCQGVGKPKRKRNPPTKKECSFCHRIKIVSIRLKDGIVVCTTCRYRHSLRRIKPFKSRSKSPLLK